MHISNEQAKNFSYFVEFFKENEIIFYCIFYLLSDKPSNHLFVKEQFLYMYNCNKTVLIEYL